MESFALAAQHAGAINHVHSFHFSASAVDVAKEVRNIAIVVVSGWVAVTTIQAIRSSYKKET